MKIVSIMWQSYMNMLLRASRNVGDSIELKVYSTKRLEEEPEKIEAALKEAETADAILLYRSTESVWEMMEKRLQELG